MAETEHQCVGCRNSHEAAFWYSREGDTDMYTFREWLCGSKYSELPEQDKERWSPSEPS